MTTSTFNENASGKHQRCKNLTQHELPNILPANFRPSEALTEHRSDDIGNEFHLTVQGQNCT
jgi:hypothetical protein